MRFFIILRSCLLGACAALALGFLTQEALAAPGRLFARNGQAVAQGTANPAVRDVALQSNSALHGQVVDNEGMAQANYEVWVTRDDGRSLRTRTDASGRFLVNELPAGDYRIETAAGGGKYRLWSPKSAPVGAQSSVLLIVRTRIAG